MVIINDNLSVGDDELEFTATCSSGPGGQNVNKVATRVLLQFDVANSPSLSPWQKQQIRSKLATRINKEGILRIICQQTRSQVENKELATLRFAQLIKESLIRLPARRKTRPTLASKKRRLDSKKQQSQKKQNRRSPNHDD